MSSYLQDTTLAATRHPRKRKRLSSNCGCTRSRQVAVGGGVVAGPERRVALGFEAEQIGPGEIRRNCQRHGIIPLTNIPLTKAL